MKKETAKGLKKLLVWTPPQHFLHGGTMRCAVCAAAEELQRARAAPSFAGVIALQPCSSATYECD